jgi:hypothetical protein
MKTVTIEKVLADIAEYASTEGSFTIGFVRSTGKKKGEVKTILARYGAPDGVDRSDVKITRNTEGVAFRGTRKIALHIDNFTIPLTDLKENRYNSPKISHIISFNKQKVYH